MDRIDARAKEMGVVLPVALRQLLSAVDGFPADSMDSEGFRFWSLEEVTTVATYENGERSFDGADQAVLFADYLHWSWAYAVDCSAPGGRVLLIGAASGLPELVADTFEQFLAMYLRDDHGLYTRAQ